MLAEWIKLCLQCQSFHCSILLQAMPMDDGGGGRSAPSKPATELSCLLHMNRQITSVHCML